MITDATKDYSASQDLVAHRKVSQPLGVSPYWVCIDVTYLQRGVRVQRNLDTHSAMLLEEVTTKDGDQTIEPTFVVAGTLVHSNLPPILSKDQ